MISPLKEISFIPIGKTLNERIEVVKKYILEHNFSMPNDEVFEFLNKYKTGLSFTVNNYKNVVSGRSEEVKVSVSIKYAGEWTLHFSVDCYSDEDKKEFLDSSKHLFVSKLPFEISMSWIDYSGLLERDDFEEYRNVVKKAIKKYESDVDIEIDDKSILCTPYKINVITKNKRALKDNFDLVKDIITAEDKSSL